MEYEYLVIDEHSDLTSKPYGNTGYLGWQKPGELHEFSGQRPVGKTVPRSEWVDRIKAGQGSFLSDLLKSRGVKAKDQNGLNFCWAYGTVRAYEAARIVEGLPHIDFSPESVAGPLTNWRNIGGYASEAFGQLQQEGCCPSSDMDSPHSLSPRRWNSAWQTDAASHEVADWYDIGTSFDEVITCLFLRVPVAAGLDWWGHLVCFLDPVILPDGSVGVLFQNSWGVNWPTAGANGFATLTEAKATPDGAAAPIIVTSQD